MIKQQRISMIKTISILLLGIFIALPSQAARVTKGKKIYLQFSKKEAAKVSKGAKVWIYSKNKKRRGLAVLMVVKGNRGLALLKKGKAKRSWYAKASGGKASPRMKNKKKMMAQKGQESENDEAMEDNGSDSTAMKRWVYGVYGGIYSLTMNVVVNSEEVATTGMNFGLKGYLQLNWTPSIALMGVVGYQGFSSTGEATGNSCDSLTTTDCSSSIQFLAMEGWAKWYFTRSKTSWWAGAGGAFDFPLAKTSKSLKEEDIGLTNFIQLGGGADLTLGNKTIPVWFEYSLMPATETVKANYMGINIGYQF